MVLWSVGNTYIQIHWNSTWMTWNIKPKHCTHVKNEWTNFQKLFLRSSSLYSFIDFFSEMDCCCSLRFCSDLFVRSVKWWDLLMQVLSHLIFAFLSFILSHLLQRDYSFLGNINVWPPLVKIGIYSSTISAAMSNLIGASRILYAMSKDNLFGEILEKCHPLPNGCSLFSFLSKVY